jgi:hypothetical protein
MFRKTKKASYLTHGSQIPKSNDMLETTVVQTMKTDSFTLDFSMALLMNVGFMGCRYCKHNKHLILMNFRRIAVQK